MFGDNNANNPGMPGQNGAPSTPFMPAPGNLAETSPMPPMQSPTLIPGYEPLLPTAAVPAPAAPVPLETPAVVPTAPPPVPPIAMPTLPTTPTPVSPAAPVQLDVPSNDALIQLKQQALQSLTPLVSQLDQAPEEKFKITMMMLQASDNPALVKEAYDLANQIQDEKARAKALLDVVNEINYFTQQHAANGDSAGS